MKLAATVLPTLLLTSTISTAFAQPGATVETTPAAPAAPAPAAPVPVVNPAAAPQTHDWNDVNHVNGQLVKVGESNEYLKTFRKTNISSNPLGWMVGFFGVSASHAITDNIAVRGDLNYVNPVGDSDFEFWEADVTVPLYLKRTYQGAFLEPGVMIRGTRETHSSYEDNFDDQGNWISTTETKSTETDVVAGPQVMFGWHASWDSGFNVAAAFGVGRDLSSDDDTDEYDDDEGVFVNGYFRVGYAF